MLSENALKEMPTLANRWSNFRFSSGIQVYFWMQRFSFVCFPSTPMKGKLSCPYRGSETPVQGRSNPRTGENADPSRGQRRSQQGKAAAAPASEKEHAHGSFRLTCARFPSLRQRRSTLKNPPPFFAGATRMISPDSSPLRGAPAGSDTSDGVSPDLSP